MKANYRHKLLIMLLFFTGISVGKKIYAQDAEVAPTTLSLKYFLPENKVPYINVITRKKVGRKFEPVTGITVNVYLTSAAPENLLGKVVTASNGEGRVGIPEAMQPTWDPLDVFTIVAESVPSGKEEVLNAEMTIKKAMLAVDTTSEDGVRTVTGQLKVKKGNEWIPVPDVEMKLKIKRELGNLTVGDAESYTSDSSGIASAEFNKDSMPGDNKGNIILLARVEDNDDYGNLVAEKTAPWGVPEVVDAHFWHRTLWSRGNLAPTWLIIIALSIIIGVWGTLIFLVRRMFVIKKMGTEYDRNLIKPKAA